jgi:hypothetical protein
MDNFRNYQRCNVMGEGEMRKTEDKAVSKFEVIDVSASGIRIKASGEFDVNEEVQMDIRFAGHLLEIPLKASGIVSKKRKLGNLFEYAVKFTNLSGKERIEIDEIVKKTCGWKM